MSQPADWGHRVQQLTDESRQLYAKALRRYNDLLVRVSQGHLPADAVQRQFRDYLQEQAPASTRTLVELSVGLLAGLVYIEARYRDALLDGLLPPEPPPPPPPDPSTVDVATWFQVLSRYAADQGTRSLARNQRLIERVATGQVTAADVQAQGRRYMEHAAPQLLGEVMALGLGFVEQMQRASAAVSDGLYDRLLGPEPGAPPRPEPPVCLDLTGPANSIVSATLLFENTRPTTAAITCQASDVAARSGTVRFVAPFEIRPPQMTLAPGERGEVQIHLSLSSPPFEIDQDYAATIVIDGAGDRPQVVQVLMRASRPVTPATVTPAAAPASSDGVRATPTPTPTPTPTTTTKTTKTNTRTKAKTRRPPARRPATVTAPATGATRTAGAVKRSASTKVPASGAGKTGARKSPARTTVTRRTRKT